MKKLTESMKIYANDKATAEEKGQIRKMYGDCYYGLNYGDIIPEVGMKIKAGEKTVEITEIYFAESHNVIMVVTAFGKSGWQIVLKMIEDKKAEIIE